MCPRYILCSLMMKSAIMVSSSSSQRRMNNAPGESGPSAASPNDVHHRCRWQGNDQILVLHVELQQELAQFPEAGQTSCFLSGLVRHGRCCMAPIGPLEAEWRQPIGPHRGISTAMKGDITHLGIVHRPSQNVPSFTPVERPMPSQNAAATHTRMCVLHRERGQCAPTPVKQHSAAAAAAAAVAAAAAAAAAVVAAAAAAAAAAACGPGPAATTAVAVAGWGAARRPRRGAPRRPPPAAAGGAVPFEARCRGGCRIGGAPSRPASFAASLPSRRARVYPVASPGAATRASATAAASAAHPALPPHTPPLSSFPRRPWRCRRGWQTRPASR